MKELKRIGKFLIKHENKFAGDEMFGVIFPVICNKLNKLDNLDEIFEVFLKWWDNNAEFRLINNDVGIASKFIEYYKGVYQLVLEKNKVIKKWVENGTIPKDMLN